MRTPYGKELVKIRERFNETQKVMALRLAFSTRVLSGIEKGVRTIPKRLTISVLKSYDLTNKERQDLVKAESETDKLPLKTAYQRIKWQISTLITTYEKQSEIDDVIELEKIISDLKKIK